MRGARVAVLFALVFAAGAVLAIPPQKPDENKYCDNSGQKDTRSRFHNCDCNKSKAECDQDHPAPSPEYGCKTYCKPEHCDCSTKSCS